MNRLSDPRDGQGDEALRPGRRENRPKPETAEMPPLGPGPGVPSPPLPMPINL